MGSVVVAMAVAGAAVLPGCTGPSLTEGLTPYQRVADTWVGASQSDLGTAWGTWNGSRNLPAGAHQVVYSSSRSVAGVEIGCEARFTVSAAGVVTRAEVSGTVGGCRQMMADAPARPR